MKIKNNILSVFILSVFLLTSCATTVKTTVKRPAELDLNGANSISVLPIQTQQYSSVLGVLDDVYNILSFFTEYDDYDPEEKIAEYATTKLTQTLLSNNYFEVVSPTAVEVALKNGTRAPTDVYLTGYITSFYSDIDKEVDVDTVSKTNSEGNVVTKKIYKDYYKRKVEFTLELEIIEATTNKIIGRQSEKISETSLRYENKNDVPTSLEMIDDDIDRFLKKFLKKIQPYNVTKTLKLKKDSSKSQAMKDAKNYAKDGHLIKAKDKYLEIFLETGLFEAGYNAALLYQALGDLDEAELLMNRIYNETGSSEVLDALADIRKEKEYSQKLQEQTELREIMR